MSIKGVLLDFGGTIAKESKFDHLNGFKAILKYCTNNYKGITAYDLYELNNFVDKKIGREKGYVKLHSNLEYPERILTNYIYDYYNLDFSVSKDELEYIFWKASTNIFKLDNIEDALKILKKNKLKIGILSNISFSQYALEKRIYDIFPNISFDCIISSAQYGFRKPDKLIFDLSARKLNLQTKDILFIGDNYENDVIGSLDAGMKSIFLSQEKICTCDNYLGKYKLFNSWQQITKYFKGGFYE